MSLKNAYIYRYTGVKSFMVWGYVTFLFLIRNFLVWVKIFIFLKINEKFPYYYIIKTCWKLKIKMFLPWKTSIHVPFHLNKNGKMQSKFSQLMFLSVPMSLCESLCRVESIPFMVSIAIRIQKKTRRQKQL